MLVKFTNKQNNEFYINADMIESVIEDPYSSFTFIFILGTPEEHYAARESLDEVVRRINEGLASTKS